MSGVTLSSVNEDVNEAQVYPGHTCECFSFRCDFLSVFSPAACNCHRHSFDCYYDPEVDERRASLDIHGHYRGGGVCLNCQVPDTPETVLVCVTCDD